MAPKLPPRFGKVLALMRSTTHEGERASAQGKATTLARASGLSLDAAIALWDAEHGGPEAVAAAERRAADERRRGSPAYRAWQARVGEIIARYGSEEAALAPCWREQRIWDALGALRKPQDKPHHRWTDALDGWTGVYQRDIPARVRAAVAGAYPMPTTFGEAKAEHDYWQARESEIADLISHDGDMSVGIEALDLPAQVRADMVRDLVEWGLPATSLWEVYGRIQLLRESDFDLPESREAIFRDIERLAHAERDLSTHPSTAEKDPQPHLSSLRGRIVAMLERDSGASDRAVARALGCSPTTVGKVRSASGHAAAERSVHRGGQMFRMKPPKAKR